MRTILFVILLWGACLKAQSFKEIERSSEMRRVEEQLLSLSFEDPLRRFGDQVFDLGPVFDYITNHFRGDDKGRQWYFLHGTVSQLTSKDGVMVYANVCWIAPSLFSQAFEEKFANRKHVRLINYPRERALVDGDSISAFVRHEGRFQYTNVSGSLATVESYDYGRTASPVEIREAAEIKRGKAEDAARQEQDRKLEMLRKREAEKAKRTAAIQAKVVQFQIQQASNGLPSFQYGLALRYLTGDGVPKDEAQARRWLRAAADQGNEEAAAKLKALSPPVP